MLSESESRTDLVQFETFLQAIKEESTRKKIILVEYLTIFLTIICCLTTGYLALEDDSMAAMAVSADSLLDILVHIIVIWCYHKPMEKQAKNTQLYTSVFIAVLFFFHHFMSNTSQLKIWFTQTNHCQVLLL